MKLGINNKREKKLVYGFFTTVVTSGIILSGIYFFFNQAKQKSLSKEKIPVITANPDPVKIKPKDPGGMLILHRNKKIYDVLDKTLTNKKAKQVSPKLNKHQNPRFLEKTNPLILDESLENKKVFPKSSLTGAKGFEIQIAALSTKKAALLFWKRISGNYENIFSKLKPKIQKIKVPGKGNYFRLRVGPIKQKDLAMNLCKKLKAKRMECFVVEP